MQVSQLLLRLRALPRWVKLIFGCVAFWQWLELLRLIQVGKPKRNKLTSKAVCVLHEEDKSGVSGVVWLHGKPLSWIDYLVVNISSSIHLAQHKGSTRIVAELSGLKPRGKHSLHIHERGNVVKGSNSVGKHYDPFGRPHGGPFDDESKRHVGDLGNVYADATGKGRIDRTDRLVSINGECSVVGRAIVCHVNEDDCGRGSRASSKIDGNSGKGIAVGVIGIA